MDPSAQLDARIVRRHEQRPRELRDRGEVRKESGRHDDVAPGGGATKADLIPQLEPRRLRRDAESRQLPRRELNGHISLCVIEPVHRSSCRYLIAAARASTES